MYVAGEEQLPFAVEAREQPSWRGKAGRVMQRVDSEPPTPVSRQVLVKQSGQQTTPQPLFQGKLLNGEKNLLACRADEI